jgi:hypothetical protein
MSFCPPHAQSFVFAVNQWPSTSAAVADRLMASWDGDMIHSYIGGQSPGQARPHCYLHCGQHLPASMMMMTGGLQSA